MRTLEIGFGTAVAASWMLVLPEYLSNVAATPTDTERSFSWRSVWSASPWSRETRQLLGFALLAVATLLITYRG